MAIHHEMTMFSDSEESWREWLEKSVRLFEKHVFATATARAERQETQAKNAKILATMLQIEREHPSSRLS